MYVSYAQAFAIESVEQHVVKSLFGGRKVPYFSVRTIATVAFTVGAELAIMFKDQRVPFITAFLVKPEKVGAMESHLRTVAAGKITRVLGGITSTAGLVMRLESAKWVENGHPEDWMSYDWKAKLPKETAIYVVLEHAANGVAMGLHLPSEWATLAAMDAEGASEMSRISPDIVSEAEAAEFGIYAKNQAKPFLDFCDRFHPVLSLFLRSVSPEAGYRA